MATKYFTGEADAVAQVSTGTITAVDATPANNTFTVTIGGVAVSVAGVTSAAATAAALVAALNASTHPYFAAITWSVPSGANVRGTADVAGVPFTAVLSKSGAGTGTVTDFSATTACAGPEHWGSAANWSDGSIPANADNVIIEGISGNILWGLDQSGVTLASLTIRKTFTGKLGLDGRTFATARNGDNPETSKQEYRTTYLHIGYDRADVGQHVGSGVPSGSSRIKLRNAKSGASTTVVHDTASAPAETGFPAVRLLAAHASADIVVRGAPAGVGIAMDEAGETSTVGAVSVSAGALYIGPGVTLTSLSQSGGTCTLQAAATVSAVNVTDGTLITEGNFTITTLNAKGGTVFPNNIKSGGNAITTLNLEGARVDGRQSREARTWDTVNPDSGTLIVDDAVVTITTMDAPAGVRQMTVT